MAFIKAQDTQINSRAFVQQLKVKVVIGGRLQCHNTAFNESIALSSFSRYICSASYAMMQRRRGQYAGESYRGY